MPYSPLSLCTTPGCGALVQSGKCDAHRKQARKESDAQRPHASARGYDHKWRAFRASFLSRHRECEGPRCMALPWWQRPDATDVDHVDGKGPLGPRGYDESNLMALCHACHSHITATRDGGFGHTGGRGQ